MQDLLPSLPHHAGVELAARLPQSENSQAQGAKRETLSVRPSRVFLQFGDDLWVGDLEVEFERCVRRSRKPVGWRGFDRLSGTGHLAPALAPESRRQTRRLNLK